VLTLLLIISLFGFFLRVAQLGLISYRIQQTQTIADVSILSSLRLRAEALQTIANRWSEFGKSFGVAGFHNLVNLHSSLWGAVEQKVSDLKRSLSGYQGRTTAVIKVVAEANGFRRDDVDVRDDAGSKLDLIGQPVVFKDEKGKFRTLDAVWYQRGWAIEDKFGDSEKTTVHMVQGSIYDWMIYQEAHGSLVWDVEKNDPMVFLNGNGGYPRDWSEALSGGNLIPNRWAQFRARLLSKPGA
jgi:hypothetical protein